MTDTDFSPASDERRQHPRLTMKTDCLVFDSNGAVGQVVDINPYGLGYKTIYHIPESRHRQQRGLLCSPSLMITDLPHDIVNMRYLESPFQFSKIKSIRYGIRFKDLTAGQKSQLDALIQDCLLD